MAEYPSYPSTLYWDPAGGTSWVKIGQTQDLDGPSTSRNSIEASHRDIDSGSFFKTFFPGMADGGEVSFPIVFDPSLVPHGGSGGTSLYESMTVGPCIKPKFKLDYNICAGGGTFYWIFDGFVTRFSPNAPVEGVHTADVAAKVDGRPVPYYSVGP
jgi:hypothetical protein